MKHISIFASGSGTNAENIIKFFHKNDFIKVTQVLTNNKNAKVIDRCKRLNINCILFNREDFFNSDKILNHLKESADFIVLAGFLWRVPEKIIDTFDQKIINIHPALLPKYGGKGMYGMHIHKAVVKNKEKESGITIHYVNKNYDDGAIIFQKKVDLPPLVTVNEVARKISLLEMEFFPKIIETILKE